MYVWDLKRGSPHLPSRNFCTAEINPHHGVTSFTFQLSVDRLMSQAETIPGFTAKSRGPYRLETTLDHVCTYRRPLIDTATSPEYCSDIWSIWRSPNVAIIAARWGHHTWKDQENEKYAVVSLAQLKACAGWFTTCAFARLLPSLGKVWCAV